MKKLIQQYAVIFYFISAYAIAWGGTLLTFRQDGFKPYDGESILSGSVNPNFFFVWIAMLLGAAIAGITFTRITDGRRGVGKLWASIKKWKVGFKWYVLAVFIFPHYCSSYFTHFVLSPQDLTRRA